MTRARVETEGETQGEDWPGLTEAERDRRWREVRWRMDLAGLDCLLVWGNES